MRDRRVRYVASVEDGRARERTMSFISVGWSGNRWKVVGIIGIGGEVLVRDSIAMVRSGGEGCGRVRAWCGEIW